MSAAQSNPDFDFSKSYDEIPYDSYAYPASQASQLWTMGHLFGVDVAPFENARVLELGCAAGGNIMTAAEAYPNATFVGVDYSERQIKDGQALIDKAGIKNMTLHQMSIEDITEEFGKFDYIIAHGLMSWIPRDLQPQVLKVCEQNLSENGIAFVSFNAYPAWKFYEGMREMMLYHSKPLKNEPAVKHAAQAKAFLKFLIENTQSKDEGYKKLLEPELTLLNRQKDFYVLHDYLEDNNNPLWFKDFYAMTEEHGLQYITDSNLPTTYIGNYKAAAQKALKGQSLEHVEQYMDFLLNRRFRQALVCKKDVRLNRNLSAELISDFALTTEVKKVAKPMPVGQQVFSARGLEFTVNGNVAIEMFHILLENKNVPMMARDLLDEMIERTGVSEEEAVKVLHHHGVSMVLHGAISIHGTAGEYACEISNKPQVSKLIRVMAEQGDWANSRRCEAVHFSEVERVLVQYMNGENTIDEIVKSLQLDIRNGKLPIRKGGKDLSASENLNEEVQDIVGKALEGFKAGGILVS